MTHTSDIAIATDLCLLPDGSLTPAVLHCTDGIVASVDSTAVPGVRSIDARGLLVLPGIVDFHGDAFERQIMPRPKTMFPLDLAFHDTDNQLLANGITTAYHGITISWEPGLRSLAQSLAVIAALDSLETRLICDHRIQLRFETYAVDQVPAAAALFSRHKKPMLAFNDHTSATLAGGRSELKFRGDADRAMVTVEQYRALLNKAGERAADVPACTREMARLAREAGVAMLSHDDRDQQMRAFYRELGAGICEFPLSWEAAEAAAAMGDAIVMGAPNVVRGGSHNNAIGAEVAIARGLCSILASDYYYPAPLAAALSLWQRGVLNVADAWALVSSTPAAACGLADRGVIAPGKRADLIIVDPETRQVVMSLVAGRVVFQRAEQLQLRG